MTKITVMKNSFVVSSDRQEIISYLNNIRENCIKYETIKVRTANGFRDKVVPGNIYIAGNRLLNEYVLVLRYLPDLIQFIRLLPDVEDIDVKIKKPKTTNIKLKTVDYTDKGYQTKYIDSLKTAEGARLVALQTGQGKALWDKTKILMHSKHRNFIWKYIGDIEEGDIVVTPSGGKTKVLKVHKQGVIPLYRVKFKDNRCLRACGDHLWEVSYTDVVEEILNTYQLISLLDRNIPVTIKPITPSEDVGDPTSPNMWDKTLTVRSTYVNKIISDYSLSSSDEEVRLAMSSDGYTNELVNTVRSLGYTIEINKAENEIIYYTIYFNKPLELLSITPDGSDEATCITINSKEAMYVTEGYIPTHNTYIACRVMEERGKRVTIVIKPEYISKWIEDLKELYPDITKDDMMIVAGGHNLIKLMLKKRKDLPRFIIISTRTLTNYYTEYESVIDLGLFRFPTVPHNLFDDIYTDTLLVDEVHEEFYCIYKTFLYANCNLFLGLSATFVTNDKAMTRFHLDVFPYNKRLDFLSFDRYVYMYNIGYRLPMTNVKHAAPGGYGYSHIIYEKSIMKYPSLLEYYLRMIEAMVNEHYLPDSKGGYKLIVFCATVKMCTIVNERLEKKYVNYTVKKYTSGDPYSNVIEPDMRVTTIKSGGTAIDIPKLLIVVNTVATNSKKANLQLVGRLRKIEGKIVKAVMLWNSDIRTHSKYRRNLIRLYNSRAKKILSNIYS